MQLSAASARPWQRQKGQAVRGRAGDGVTAGRASGTCRIHTRSELSRELQLLQGHSKISGGRTPLRHAPCYVSHLSGPFCKTMWLRRRLQRCLWSQSPFPSCTRRHHARSQHRPGQPRTMPGAATSLLADEKRKLAAVTGRDFSRISTSGAMAAAKPCESLLVMRAGLRDLEPGPRLAPASQAFKRDSDFLRLKQP